MMSRFACLLARGLTPVRDATSGFFLVNRELARGATISAGGFKICLELLIRSRPRRVAEVPYVFAGRTAGERVARIGLWTRRSLAVMWQCARIPDGRGSSPVLAG